MELKPGEDGITEADIKMQEDSGEQKQREAKLPEVVAEQSSEKNGLDIEKIKNMF